MKGEQTRQKFLELRAQGKSLRAIEIEIGTSRGTLAKWEQDYREELTNLKAIERDAMREKYLLTQQAQLDLFGTQFTRLNEELEKRDLSDVPTPKLFELVLKYSTRLTEDFPAQSIDTEEQVARQKANRESPPRWLPEPMMSFCPGPTNLTR
ncbi:MAG: helix-turn-helix domain-containing protein [Halobacteriota archaeon]|jgi:transcriptional regulator with XRE-family HTH domain